MKFKQILQKIYNYNKLTRNALIALLWCLFIIPHSCGKLLFLATKPFVALSHLLMGNFHTAKYEISNFTPSVNLKDVILFN